MQPGQHDFTIRRGNSDIIGFRLKNRNIITGEETLATLDGAQVVLTVARAGGDVMKSIAVDGGLIVNAITRLVTWQMSPADTQAFPPGASTYLVRYTAPDGTVSDRLTGKIIAEG
ncbi:hypothetical protein [Methylobacterium sp. SD21]|uniref:hypothetical protein n=1 Tax=Methylobacterium litchii TaxID=3138810 RepID=UPI00313DF5AE